MITRAGGSISYHSYNLPNLINGSGNSAEFFYKASHQHWKQSGAPGPADYAAFGNTTRKGFTGHEMLDSVSVVHMNGRIYDPYFGRSLSPDTVISIRMPTRGMIRSSWQGVKIFNQSVLLIPNSSHALLSGMLESILDDLRNSVATPNSAGIKVVDGAAN